MTGNAKSGKIVLSNSVGEGVSEGNFTIEYPAPTISSTGMPTEIEMGNKLLISGSHMNVISAVLLQLKDILLETRLAYFRRMRMKS